MEFRTLHEKRDEPSRTGNCVRHFHQGGHLIFVYLTVSHQSDSQLGVQAGYIVPRPPCSRSGCSGYSFSLMLTLLGGFTDSKYRCGKNGGVSALDWCRC